MTNRRDLSDSDKRMIRLCHRIMLDSTVPMSVRRNAAYHIRQVRIDLIPYRSDEKVAPKYPEGEGLDDDAFKFLANFGEPQQLMSIEQVLHFSRDS